MYPIEIGAVTQDGVRSQQREGSGRTDAEPAATVLLAGRAPLDREAWQRELRAATRRTVHLEVASAFDVALERLGTDSPDVLLLDHGFERGGELVQWLHEQAADTALVVFGDGIIDRTDLGALSVHAHELVIPGAAPKAVARAAIAALERRDLQLRLRQRDRELEESQARFGNIIQRTTDALIVVGADGRVRFVNPAAESLFGRSAADLIGSEFGLPIVRGEATELDIVRRDRDEPIVAELRAAETQWNSEAAQLISLRDITDRKKAEQRAHRLVLEQASRERAEEANRRSRFLAEASAALDASLDLDTTLSELARLIVPRLADWCVIELVEEDGARRLAAAQGLEERRALVEQLKQERTGAGSGVAGLLQTEEVLLLRGLDSHRLRELAGDGAELLTQLGARSLVVVPLRSREQRLGALLVACDERNFDEEDLALAEEVAARAARAIDNARLYHAALAANQAKSDFLAIVSHELRTPLNAIMGYTDMLLAGIAGPLQEQQIQRLRRIDASARHLLQIIEEILSHAGLEAGREEPRPRGFALGELIEAITTVAEPLVREKRLEFDVRVRDPARSLFTDFGKVRQIALNLVSNAVKFTDAGTVALHADVEGDDLVIVVSDTGIGIAPEHHDRIFDPFWQVEQPLTRHAGGTGLGLSVSRRLAQVLGGTITVHSELGAGSTFTLRVPARYEATAVSARRASRLR